MFLQSMQDIQFAANLIFSCAIGQTSFISFCVSLPIENILNRYRLLVGTATAKSRECFLKDLEYFLTDSHPPKILIGVAHKVNRIGLRFLDDILKIQLGEWVCTLKKRD